MRRNKEPYGGKRYLLNTRTGEVHDLDNEMNACKIDEIKENHIYMCNTYNAAKIHAELIGIKNCNGCYHCMPLEDNG